MKGIISIFAMPQELEDLAATLERLKRNSVLIDDSVQLKIDLTMCLSDELTDWNNSKLPKEYIKERTEELFDKYTDWCYEKCLEFEMDTKTLGCVSQRRKSWKENSEADFFIWLDCDMMFRDDTLQKSITAAKLVKEHGIDLFVITPQFVKQWDSTWDVITNKSYLKESVNYHIRADIYKECLKEISEVQISQIDEFKFAGGWFTLLSKKLIDRIGIPESFGHYGLEDTLIMYCASIMRSRGENVSQFVLENVIAGEIHKSRTNSTIKKHIASISRKDEFRQVAERNFQKELEKFVKG